MSQTNHIYKDARGTVDRLITSADDLLAASVDGHLSPAVAAAEKELRAAIDEGARLCAMIGTSLDEARRRAAAPLEGLENRTDFATVNSALGEIMILQNLEANVFEELRESAEYLEEFRGWIAEKTDQDLARRGIAPIRRKSEPPFPPPRPGRVEGRQEPIFSRLR